MKATEDHQSLFGQVKKGLKKNWPTHRKVELKKNEYWNEVDISFEEAEFHQGYKLSVVKLILEYNKIIRKALKSQREIPINDIDDFRRDFKFIHVQKDHIMNELKKCPYMSPEQAKEMFEFMISGLNFHGPMLKFCVDCVTQQYKGEMAFLFCVFCQIQKTLLENSESQKEFADHALQRNRGKRVAEELVPFLRGKLKSFLVPENVVNFQIENATKEFFKEFCSVVMKMIEGLSMKN